MPKKTLNIEESEVADALRMLSKRDLATVVRHKVWHLWRLLFAIHYGLCCGSGWIPSVGWPIS